MQLTSGHWKVQILCAHLLHVSKAPGRMRGYLFIFRAEFIHVVSTFVQAFTGILCVFLWHLRDSAGLRTTEWQMAGCAACLSETAAVH